MANTKAPERASKRTKIITAASVGAVALAGLFAIGANLGILTNADQSNVGTVSAAGDLVPTDTSVVDVYLDRSGDPLTSTSAAPPESKRFTVDEAGTVDVSIGADGAHLDLVSPARGWTAKPVATTNADLAVRFTDGTRTLDFTAAIAADRTVTGDVTESSAATSARQHDDDHDHGHDKDQDKDHDHDHDGSDDDD